MYLHAGVELSVNSQKIAHFPDVQLSTYLRSPRAQKEGQSSDDQQEEEDLKAETQGSTSSIAELFMQLKTIVHGLADQMTYLCTYVKYQTQYNIQLTQASHLDVTFPLFAPPPPPQ